MFEHKSQDLSNTNRSNPCHNLLYLYKEPFSWIQALIWAALFVACRGLMKSQELNLSHDIWYRSHTANVIEYTKQFQDKMWTNEHDLWIELWFSKFPGKRSHKCNMYLGVRFCRDEPQSWSTECLACEVHKGGMVQCCQFGGTYCQRMWYLTQKLYSKGLTPQLCLFLHDRSAHISFVL